MQATMLPLIEIELALTRIGADARLSERIMAARRELAEGRPTLQADVLRLSRSTLAGMGIIGRSPARRVHTLLEDGLAGTYANVLGLLNCLPHLAEYHRAHDIDEAVTIETLSDLPRHI